LFALIRRLKSAGRSVIYISHRLDEVFELADRVTVLKDGRLQGTFATSDTTPEKLVTLMVGRELLAIDSARRDDVTLGPIALEVRGLSDDRAGDGPRLHDVSFAVRRGEILALAGLSGAGRTETALAVFGARPDARGEIRVEGRPFVPRSPRDGIAAGIGYLPEDRKEAGLFLDMSIAENIASAGLIRFGGVWQDDVRRREVAERFRSLLQIAARGVQQPVISLSGGNQQKVLLAKWLLLEPKVLLVDEPTRGVDVGAKADVHRLLRELAQQGTAVVVISSDLPEVFALADRIVVLREGRVTGDLLRAEATEERIVTLASVRSAA
jgi:ABC-type sugar transport system ATPase subunit